MEYELAAEGKLNYCIKDLCGDPSSLGELHGMVIPENWIETMESGLCEIKDTVDTSLRTYQKKN